VLKWGRRALGYTPRRGYVAPLMGVRRRLVPPCGQPQRGSAGVPQAERRSLSARLFLGVTEGLYRFGTGRYAKRHTGVILARRVCELPAREMMRLWGGASHPMWFSPPERVKAKEWMGSSPSPEETHGCGGLRRSLKWGEPTLIFWCCVRKPTLDENVREKNVKILPCVAGLEWPCSRNFGFLPARVWSEWSELRNPCAGV